MKGAGGNNIEGGMPDRCPVGEQLGSGRDHATARTGVAKAVNLAVMECCFFE